MVKEIRAKVLLSHVRQPDDWFGLKYNMNLYRGCQHQCVYCDSRSECYRIDHFGDEVLVKANAVDLLQKELAGKRVKGTIGTGSMNDPYMPLEKKLNLTGRALEVIARHRFPAHIITKSDLVLKDLETLCEINRVFAAVSFTITTAEDGLARKVEPGAPPTSVRLRAMKTLAARGIATGVVMMPILPFIGDNGENIKNIVELARENGARYIIPWFGMSLRDRQRAYYYARLEELFPGMKRKYEKRFGNRYHCPANNAKKLEGIFKKLLGRYEIATKIKPYALDAPTQLSLF
ncbi:MAG: radical SAM protein [Desulfobacterales bacterium]|nr:radical SAM protein [Desulfobacterales bacterium]